ncbi:hypothetical protein [Ktedonobacter racemifer]|uniref:GIY-YIG domain-containing protein n=1 Tax=Ktedonobacter racemifer DSM 44963 TaxID=485913 RepID=D6TX19_KTERA|nr:hypothetical protein [Ktedonobacter racemifer]EFH84752.1 hypothetical protein Krac_5856 [Ktedonobacter racemifer DSM 44963]
MPIHDIEALKRAYLNFRRNTMANFIVDVRRTRAQQIRALTFDSKALSDIETFEREVWLFESRTYLRSRRLELDIFSQYYEQAQLRKAMVEHHLALSDLHKALHTGDLELQGNYTFRQTSTIFAPMLKEQDTRFNLVKQALHLFNNTTLTPRQKVEQVLTMKGFDENNATGLAMIFHPEAIGIVNSVTRIHLQQMGHSVASQQNWQQLQDVLISLHKLLRTRDFIELDGFLYVYGTQLTQQNGSAPAHRQHIASLITKHEQQNTDGNTPLPRVVAIKEPSQPYTEHKSFMSVDWEGIAWTSWLPLSSPALPTGRGIYRVRAIERDELFYIGSTGSDLRGRIGDLYRNLVKDRTQMPFNDPHTAAPSLWAWQNADGLHFECSAATDSTHPDLDILVHYLLWRYRVETGTSTLANHGRFHPLYTKSGGRKAGRRGERLPEGQTNLHGGPSYPPLLLTATPVEQTWMWLNWSELYSFHSRNEVPTSYGIYKIVDSDSGELLFIGSAKNLRSAFQTQARKNWQCPGPAFAYSLLPDTLLPHHIHEIGNDLLGGYFAYAKVAPKFQG